MTDRGIEYHVLTKSGDASAEIEEAVKALGTRENAGLHRYYYVKRANQTVVMASGVDSPIARVLRERAGWKEPRGQE
ncbi:MAG: hypothetical protein GEU90_05270 [Gemmatimonas sp.]|nr:hypothetical protein [Gemmatimonas sp.]